MNRLSKSVLESEKIVQQAGAHAFQVCARHVEGNKINLEIDCFLAYLKSLQRLVLRHVYEEVGKSPQKLSFNKLEGLLQFLRKKSSGSTYQLDSDLVVFVHGNDAIFRFDDKRSDFRVEIDAHPGRYDLWHDFFLEIKKTPKPLTLKSREKNIEFIDADLLSGAGKRKLSDYFIDHKVAVHERRFVPILENKNAIVWLCGLRLDDRFKITKNTKRVFKLTIGKRER